jgi:hypothetical protein
MGSLRAHWTFESRLFIMNISVLKEFPDTYDINTAKRAS